LALKAHTLSGALQEYRMAYPRHKLTPARTLIGLIAAVGFIDSQACTTISHCDDFRQRFTKQAGVPASTLRDALADGEISDKECQQLCGADSRLTSGCTLDYDHEALDKACSGSQQDITLGGSGGATGANAGAAGIEDSGGATAQGGAVTSAGAESGGVSTQGGAGGGLESGGAESGGVPTQGGAGELAGAAGADNGGAATQGGAGDTAGTAGNDSGGAGAGGATSGRCQVPIQIACTAVYENSCE
jgi:hypothetical protein